MLLLPGAEARFERVAGGCGGCAGGFGSGGGEVEVVAEGVVDAGGGGGAEDVRGGGCGCGGGDDAEGLLRRVLVGLWFLGWWWLRGGRMYVPL